MPQSQASRIVVGVDGSEQSKAALRWAARQASLTGAALEVITAWELPASWGFSPVPEHFDPEAEAEKSLKETVTEALGPSPEMEVSLRVIESHPVPALLGAAQGADLLVVGSQGHGGFKGMLLGSVSQHCAAHATCPVVVVH
ncbi:MAG: universal stress protein [Actinobacteria bacterium]|nr:universal stress protein [Actinomycetota bacterium]